MPRGEKGPAPVAVGVDAEHHADARGVELQLLDPRLGPDQVPGHDDVAVEEAERHLDLLGAAGDDRAVVLGLAGVVLLPVGHPRLGVGGHRDPRLGAVDAGLERPGAGRDLSVAVLGRALLEGRLSLADALDEQVLPC